MVALEDEVLPIRRPDAAPFTRRVTPTGEKLMQIAPISVNFPDRGSLPLRVNESEA